MNNGLIPGTTWTGTITPVGSCASAGVPTVGILSLQVQSNVAGVVELIGATVWSTQTLITDARKEVQLGGDGTTMGSAGDSCVIQTGFRLSYYAQDGTLTIEPQSSEADYSMCANGAPIQPYGWVGRANKDLLKITAYDSARCSSIVLERQAGIGPPQPPSPPTVPPDTTKCGKLDDDGLSPDERVCMQLAGCGWCTDSNYESGCCAQDAQGNPVLPCPNEYGELPECGAEWAPVN